MFEQGMEIRRSTDPSRILQAGNLRLIPHGSHSLRDRADRSHGNRNSSDTLGPAQDGRRQSPTAAAMLLAAPGATDEPTTTAKAQGIKDDG